MRRARAGAGRPGRAARVARGAGRGRAPATATRPGWCSPRPTPTSATMGAVADYLEVEPRYERRSRRASGDLLQHVVVAGPSRRLPASAFVRRPERRTLRVPRRSIGRQPRRPSRRRAARSRPLVPLAVVRVTGPHRRRSLRGAVGDAWIAEHFEQAAGGASRAAGADGHARRATCFAARTWCRGRRRDEARGILATKREIKELRDRIAAERAARGAVLGEKMAHARGDDRAGRRRRSPRWTPSTTARRRPSSASSSSVAARGRGRGAPAAKGGSCSRPSAGRPTRSATRSRRAQREARESIRAARGRAAARPTSGWRTPQRRSAEARECSREPGPAGRGAPAAHAALVERAARVAADVERLEEAARELAVELGSRARASAAVTRAARSWRAAICRGASGCSIEDRAALDRLRAEVRAADEAVDGAAQRTRTPRSPRSARRAALDGSRGRRGRARGRAARRPRPTSRTWPPRASSASRRPSTRSWPRWSRMERDGARGADAARSRGRRARRGRWRGGSERGDGRQHRRAEPAGADVIDARGGDRRAARRRSIASAR